MTSRILTPWSITYDSVTDAYTLEYSATYDDHIISSEHLSIYADPNNDLLIVMDDLAPVTLRWDICTYPASATRDVLINNIGALNTGSSVAISSIAVNTISEFTAGSGVTVDGVLLKDSAVNTNTIDEGTLGSGVTVDGVLLKDGAVTTDTLNEATADAGVTADGVLLKDTTVTADALTTSTVTFTARDADPSAPASGSGVMWVSDGTDTGANGDVIMNYNFTDVMLGCVSRHIHDTITSDVNWNGTTVVNFASISVPTAGRWLLIATGSISVASGAAVVWLSTAGPSSTIAISGSQREIASLFFQAPTIICPFLAAGATTIYWNGVTNAAGNTGVAIDVDTTAVGPALDNVPVLFALRFA